MKWQVLVQGPSTKKKQIDMQVAEVTQVEWPPILLASAEEMMPEMISLLGAIRHWVYCGDWKALIFQARIIFLPKVQPVDR